MKTLTSLLDDLEKMQTEISKVATDCEGLPVEFVRAHQRAEMAIETAARAKVYRAFANDLQALIARYR